MAIQALIVGAGPVGLTMAAELARYGVRVRIIDKAPARTDKSKALVVWSRTMELLDRSGCAAAFLEAGHRVDAASIIAGTRVLGRVEFGGVASAYPFALMLPQSDTERLLEAHLESLDIRVERRAELGRFDDLGTSVRANVSRPGSPDEEVVTDWLIGCDGAHSTVRHALGLPFAGETMRSDWILADVHLAGLRTPESELATYWHPDGVLALFPISPGRCRVIADLGLSEGGHPTDPTLAEVQAVIDQRGPGGLMISDPVWLSAFRINERKVSQYRSGRVFLAGDAAHVHSPAGGQGMNTGMQDAFNLAWKLALVCHGTGRADRLLDSYSVERGAVGTQVLANAGRLTALATMRGRARGQARNLAARLMLGLAPVRRAMADTLTEVSVGYAQGPLNGPHKRGMDGPRPGARAPLTGEHPAVGSGRAPLFALFASSEAASPGLIERHPGLLDPLVRAPFGAGGAWLVRPDGYTAAAVAANDLRPIDAYLSNLSAPA